MNYEFSAEEKEFIVELDGLGFPDDLERWLNVMGPIPPKEAVIRIKQHTLSRLGTGRRGLFTRFTGIRAAAVLMALVLIFTLVLGPHKVLGYIENLMRYVPGFGAQEIGKQTFLAASRPVIVESGNKRLEVLGLVSDDKHTLLRFRALNVWNSGPFRSSAGKPYLVDDHGERYDLRGGSSAGTGYWGSEGVLWFSPLPKRTRSVQLVIPDHEELKIGIPLAETQTLPSLDEISVSASAQDITIHVVPELRDTELAANLVFDLDAASKVTSVGDYLRKDTLPALKDQRGRTYELLRSEPDALHFKAVDLNSGPWTLTIPAVLVWEQGQATVQLPVPHGLEPLAINKKVRLGQSSLTIKEVQKVNNNLRVVVDLGKPGSRTLISFNFRPKSGRGFSGMSEHDEQTGQMKYFELNDLASLKGRTILLVLSEPQVQLNGPWVFQIKTANIITNTTYHPSVAAEEVPGKTPEDIAKK